MDKKNRIASIELLRIISMFFIVFGHFVGQGNIFSKIGNNVFNEVFFTFLGFGHRISVNIFIIISAWFMVDSNFKGYRVLKIHNQVLFYTSIITLVLFIVCDNVGITKLIQSFMPLFGKPLWFASAYIVLLLFSPFLKSIFLLSKEKLRVLVIVLFITMCILPQFSDEMDTYLDNLLWFFTVYVFVGYIKKYKELNQKYWLFLGFLIYFVLVLGKLLGLLYSSCNDLIFIIESLSDRFLHDLKTIPNFICALFIFIGFKNLKVKNNKVIELLAAGSFSVYIIHQTPALFPILWEKLLFVFTRVDINMYPLIFISECTALYLIISIIDLIRRRFIEKKWLNSEIPSFVINKIDKFYGEDEIV